MSNLDYLGEWNFGRLGTVPVYAEEYMPRDRLYIIGIPETEPSVFLVSFTGAPLPVPNPQKLRKIALIHPHPAATVTIIDYTARGEE